MTDNPKACDCEHEPAVLPPPGRSRYRQAEWYQGRKDVLLDNMLDAMPKAHGVFSGPSIDFHEWAVSKREAARHSDEVRDELIRDIFGTLVSWGMHRMGTRGAKMPRFDVFRTGILDAWPYILDLWDEGPLTTREQWRTLCRAFHSIRASTTNSRLVSSSKVLAHLLPRSVAVIDRQYTLRFLHQRNTYTNGLHPAGACFEWRLFREIHELFFYPLIQEPDFIEATARWPSVQDGRAQAMTETSLKAADSLVIGYQKLKGLKVDPGSD